MGSRVLRRRGGRIRGTGFGSSLCSSIGFLSLFLGDESLPACGGCRRSRLRWETVALPHLGEGRFDVFIVDLCRGRPGEAVGVVVSTLVMFLGREGCSGSVRVRAVRIGVLELREVRGEDGGVTAKSTHHCCLTSTWQRSYRLHDVPETSSISGMGRETPFGPDLMKTVQSLINRTLASHHRGSVIHKLLGLGGGSASRTLGRDFQASVVGQIRASRVDNHAVTGVEFEQTDFHRTPVSSAPIFGVSASSDVRITVEQSSGRPIRRPHQSGLGSPH